MTIAALLVAASTSTFCTVIGDLAEAIMTNRQLGIPMSRMMEINGADDLARLMVMEAYKEPRYSSDEYQRRAVQDFRNEIEVACYQAE
jgi:hypothetical protein